MKILWLSRHSMTAEQITHLRAKLRADVYLAAAEGDVTADNVTFPSRSRKALDSLLDLALFYRLYGDNYELQAEEFGAIAAVLPGHIAAAVAPDRLGDLTLTCPVYVPVSVPAPAAEGETRGGGVVHSHWERL